MGKMVNYFYIGGTVKFFNLLIIILGLSTNAFAKEGARKPNSNSVELSADAAKIVGNLLRGAEKSGNKAVQFQGGPQVTVYSVGNLSCYFQNSDDSVSCSAGQ
jgi:hypothetical protein